MTHKKLLIKYYKKLINSIYKNLPLYEGRDYKTNKIIYNKEEAYKMYQIHLSNLLVEIYGNIQIFYCSDNSIKLLSILRGVIQEIKMDEQKKFKRLIMECISICKKIIKEIEEKDGEDIEFKLL